jgi:hypothetical protein
LLLHGREEAAATSQVVAGVGKETAIVTESNSLPVPGDLSGAGGFMGRRK